LKPRAEGGGRKCGTRFPGFRSALLRFNPGDESREEYDAPEEGGCK